MTAADVLRRLDAELLPDFSDPIPDVNHIGAFGNRPLHVVSFWGDTQDVAALIEAGADINAKGDMGSTPLHEATEQGHLQTVKFLLDHGASVKIKNDSGKTPIDIATDQGQSDMIALLRNANKPQ